MPRNIVKLISKFRMTNYSFAKEAYCKEVQLSFYSVSGFQPPVSANNYKKSQKAYCCCSVPASYRRASRLGRVGGCVVAGKLGVLLLLLLVCVVGRGGTKACKNKSLTDGGRWRGPSNAQVSEACFVIMWRRTWANSVRALDVATNGCLW